MSDRRQQVHDLVNRPPSEQLSAVAGLLEAILDPVSRKLARAPTEDEAIGEDEEQAVAEAKEWLKQNLPIPHEQVLAEFGLTMDDFRRMAESPLPPAPRKRG